MIDRSSLIPKFSLHHYWHQKEHFALAVDTYSQWSMFAVEDGSFEFEIAASTGVASHGEIVICPPHVPFKRTITSPLSFHFILFTWENEPLDMFTEENIFMGKIHLHDTKRLSSNYYYLRKKAEQFTPADQNLKNHILKDIWLLHCEEMNHTFSFTEIASDDHLMNKAAEYLSQYAENTLSLKSLADSLDLSPVQLTRQFFRAFACTPMDFLTSIRLQKAKNMLMETDLPLDQIADNCGYENGFYFSRVFSKKMKISPSAFRKAYRV
ncbi:AraC family transcriptional regulator [Paenibacillus psychroresistens]|uniref:AraC family transcriptional regulator n=1 Tax=Paenibacillus psychroresistens TaxID=1778678 RepID=A0A6B8RJ36_9BACL|nr:AraC family transcriptional regulator [Paenibacillus psychroresistens]QGQ95602.1 AraC family transcriptional regulator [Paenibacillus psychroresistens]